MDIRLVFKNDYKSYYKKLTNLQVQISRLFHLNTNNSNWKPGRKEAVVAAGY
ncbi:hypothetical protein [Sutcliffiella horikoshii]|uniref:hypothetical protein n=1 Tax=Sutcliffiella horikoshii TaxID=79883 RepID=UPI001653EC9A|nr:hypothetical protein [Sutcliffiella horikoshii]